MNLGDTIESAIWLSGTETESLLNQFRQDVILGIEQLCKQKGFEHTPIIFIEKNPGDERVPEVPHTINGPNIRLLVAEAEITHKIQKCSFIANLDLVDLKRLRIRARDIHAIYYPGEKLSNKSCDAVIEEIGPEAAVEELRRNVGKTLH